MAPTCALKLVAIAAICDSADCVTPSVALAWSMLACHTWLRCTAGARFTLVCSPAPSPE
jgi:hypothetical protein